MRLLKTRQDGNPSGQRQSIGTLLRCRLKPSLFACYAYCGGGTLTIGRILVLAIALYPTTLWAQTKPSGNNGEISVTYGWITQHYQTTWSDPNLPAGVSRGMPPHALSSLSMSAAKASTYGEQAIAPSATESADDMGDSAILYAIDLGADGMTMVVSAKRTIQPGDCVAVERAGSYLNLRGINPGFCDPTNQATITQLRSDNAAAASRCKAAREQLQTGAAGENSAQTFNEIGMLCDGS